MSLENKSNKAQVKAFIAATDQLRIDDPKLKHKHIYTQSGVGEVLYNNSRSTRKIVPSADVIEKISSAFPSFPKYYYGYLDGSWRPTVADNLDSLIEMKDRLMRLADEMERTFEEEIDRMRRTIDSLEMQIEASKGDPK